MTALKSWQTAIAAGLALGYWVVVLAIPRTAKAWHDVLRLAIGLLGIVLVVVAVALLIAGIWWQRVRNQRGVLVLLGLVGILLSIIALSTNQAMNFTPERRFAVGVGGLAIAGLAFGITRFDSVRAAASVPAAVLVVGAATWPGATELVAEDFRPEVVKWMGILLAANGVAEAAKQVGEAKAKSQVQAAAIAANTTASSATMATVEPSGDLA
jgi:hypothetical protein